MPYEELTQINPWPGQAFACFGGTGWGKGWIPVGITAHRREAMGTARGAAPGGKARPTYLATWANFCSILASGMAPGTRSPSAKKMVGVPVMFRRRPNS